MTSIHERDDVERRLSVMLRERADAIDVRSDPDSVLAQPPPPMATRRRLAVMISVAAAVALAAAAIIATVGGDAAPSIRPVETTEATSTSVPLSDVQIAQQMMLSAEEYGQGWSIVQPSWAPDPGQLLDADIAREIYPWCRDYIAPLFEAAEAATVSAQYFSYPPSPAAVVGQYVIVFADEATAAAAHDAMRGSVEQRCAYEYRAAAGTGPDGFGGESVLPLHLHQFMADGPEGWFYYDEWTDPVSGQVYGPQIRYAAVMQIGRAIVLTSALHADGDTDNVVPGFSEEQFAQVLIRSRDRATAALEGGVMPSGFSSTAQPPTNVEMTGVSVDFLIRSDSGPNLTSSLADELSALPQVGELSPVRFSEATVDTHEGTLACVAWHDFSSLIDMDLQGDPVGDLAVDEIVVSADVAEATNVHVGDVVHATQIPTGRAEYLTVVGVFSGSGLGAEWIVSEDSSQTPCTRTDSFVIGAFAEGVDDEVARAAVAAVVERHKYAELEWEGASASIADFE